MSAHGMTPCSRGNASLYIRPLPPLVSGNVAKQLEAELQTICVQFHLYLGRPNYVNHPPPFTKTVQRAVKAVLGSVGLFVSLKDIRVQLNIRNPDRSCDVAIRAPKKVRTHPEWVVFLNAACEYSSGGFNGNIRSEFFRGKEEALDNVLRRHHEKETTGYAHADTALDIFRGRVASGWIEDHVKDLFYDHVGGHYLRTRISHVCRQVSITPHSWKGSRFVHSYLAESQLHRQFMSAILRLNDMFPAEVVQHHKADSWPPMDLVATYCNENTRLLRRSLETCAQNIKRKNVRLIENSADTLQGDLRSAPNEEALFEAVQNLQTTKEKGQQVLAIMRDARNAAEDSGACLWTHR